MSAKLTVVVEGRADAVLLNRLLSAARGLNPEFFVAGGRTALATLARNILVHEGGPVLLVADADSSSGNISSERVALLRAALRNVAHDEAFAVFAFAPQIDVIFFEAPTILRRRFSENHLAGISIEVGVLSPRATLDSVLDRKGVSREQFYRCLTDDDLLTLAHAPQAAALLSAVDGLIYAGALAEHA